MHNLYDLHSLCTSTSFEVISDSLVVLSPR